MPIPTFTPGYPPDNSSLGQTKTTIRNNLDGTFQTLSVDHINNNGDPGANPAGYHNVIHSVPQGGNPIAVPGFGQLFSKTINSFTTDQALFWETGGGLIQQLTTNITPLGAFNGYTFLSGGIILQWGVVISTASSGTTNFNVTFPNNCFNVQLTSVVSDKTNHANGMYVQGILSASEFTWNQADIASSQTGFFWMAIGN
jgi:hypothetical protein